MSVREALLALFLVTGGTLVVAGIARMHEPSALMVGGLFVAALGFLFLAEAAD